VTYLRLSTSDIVTRLQVRSAGGAVSLVRVHVVVIVSCADEICRSGEDMASCAQMT
jgi:hypothetical protein